jgi:hypothetical protein
MNTIQDEIITTAATLKINFDLILTYTKLCKLHQRILRCSNVAYWV